MALFLFAALFVFISETKVTMFLLLCCFYYGIDVLNYNRGREQVSFAYSTSRTLIILIIIWNLIMTMSTIIDVFGVVLPWLELLKWQYSAF